uniref:E1A-binding protein p400 n=1 Tax=Xenopus tropicalis TaxID=8364 RepID=A0A6I8R2Q7_XENTR
MLHGNNPQDTQPAPKPSSGNDGDQQRTQKTTPPSPAQSFTPTVSSPAPQSPSYQIQHLIMSRNPMPGQNVNITLQNVGPVVAGGQQITLTSLPISSPASPGFQFNTQPRRFEHGSPSYIQVTSPVSQQVQTQSSTQPNTVPIQALQGVRTGTSSASLGMCSQSPTRGFVDAGLLVRQLSLGPSNTGTFVIQEGSGLTQIAQSAQVHLSPGTPTVPAHSLLHSNSQAVGPVHQFGSQSSVAGSVNVQSPSTPSHLTTNLSQQLSSIIQGQIIQQQQQQQLLHGPQVSRTFSFDRTSSGMIAGISGNSAFGITSAATPTSPSQVTGPQAFSSLPLTTAPGTTLKKQTKKLEEIPPATQEDALLRKLCLDHHHQQMQALKETYTEYLIELFFLQHCQGNMMDFLPFKKKRNIYQNFLRQNDLDLEVDEEETEKNSSQAVYVQTPDPPASSVIEAPADMEIQASDPAMKQSQSPMVTLGLPLLPPVTARSVMDAGMSPSKQTCTSVANKQNDAAKISMLQNAAGPQSPFRTQLPTMPVSSVQTAMHLAQQQQLITEAHSQTMVKQSSGQPPLHNQSAQPSQEKMVDHFSSLKQPPVPASASKMGSDSVKTAVSVGLKPTSLTSPSPSIPDSVPPAVAVSPKRILSPGASKAVSPASRSPGLAGPQSQEPQCLAPVPGDAQQEALVPKPVEQESHIHQRIAELRKEGMWSPRRLPRLQEPCRTKSHWDYLLEEMSWMAADFAQERLWKQACAKKLVRTAARHCQEKQQKDARAKKEDEDRLRRIAWLAAREIQYFWSNIEQVVEIKLQVELQEKMKRAFSAQKKLHKGVEPKKLDAQNKVIDIVYQVKIAVCACTYLFTMLYVPNVLLRAKKDQAISGTNINPESSRVENNENAVKADGNQKAVISIEALLTIEGSNTTPLGARKHCRDIAEVAAAAELLLPRGSSRISCLVKTSQLPLLHGTLREYQQVGVEWLVKQYKKNLNGILADETGLGKNIQVIALFSHLASNEGVWGPYLIVARSCKILKWELELKRWCPALKILLYFGSQSELRRKRQTWNEPNNFNVCITSYKQFFKSHKAFKKMRWKYLVLDEVHQIKNMTEMHWEAILNLPSQRRLLLRDNPLPHTWKELWTMVHFLIPGLSRAYLDFPVNENDQDHDYRHTISIRLHRSTQPFILRRSKRDVERQLTKKSEHVLKCQLSNRQRALYEDVMMQPGTQDALKGGHFVSVLHVLMQLQRICNHTELVDPRLKHSSYALKAIKYKTASLILRALLRDPWKNVELASLNLIGMENNMTRFEAQVLPKQKVTRKLIQEIYNSPNPPVRPSRVKIKPSRLFEPVLYGQKPEGRTVTFPSAPQTRTVTQTTATVSQQGQVRRSPVTTPAVPQGAKAPATQGHTPPVQVGAPRPQAPAAFATAAPVRQLSQPPQQNIPSPRLVLSSQARLPTGELVKIAQLASTGGAQGRVAQPETPVTLQFQGNKFTLSQSQLRQLTAGQPLQLHGNVLQIVSAPGQYLRPQGSVVLPTMPQGTTTNTVRSQNPVGAPLPSTVSSTGLVAGRNVQTCSTTADSVPKSNQAVVSPAQESAEEKQRVIKERLDRLFFCNELRCARAPIYGTDLLSFCSLNSPGAWPPSQGTVWSWTGSVNCFLSSHSPENSSDLLRHLIPSHDQQKASLEPLAKSALCVVPPVVAATPVLMVPNPPPAYIHSLKRLEHGLRDQLAPVLRELRERTTPHCLPFPDLKLIQADSGKLEALAVLLRKLRSEGRRVLIFSQMLLMLDILELFLDFHSLTFLRIDDNANSEQCQDLMKTFNRDQRIFSVLLSTHIPNLGAYQVEADTVIFYDSDLNPVMDGKTQSWCDLVGRSKDIHVYRLVSANSIEEKLLRNGTKDLIREVAAQGSDYSLAFLTQQTIQELFEVCSPLEDSGVKAEEFVLLSQEPSPSDTITAKVAKPFVEALVEIEHINEDITDPVEEDGPNANTGISHAVNGEPVGLSEPSQFQELVELMQQLTPIEKYALHYLELFHIQRAEAHDECTEEKLNAAKREWDSKHLRELKEREEVQWEAEEEELLTYTREDAYNMDFIYDGTDGQTELMPVWTPPTPPQDENDIYIDSVMCLMYDTNPIVESKLPPVYMRKERKRHKTDPTAAGRKKKMRHGESVVPPRSLFDRAVPNPLKVRKEGKEQKKNILLKQQTQFAKPLPTLIKPVMESGPDNPEWLISEDWALLQTVKQLLELPLNLSVISPAHTPNWDLVSDVVNSCSRIYRSSKQCRSRYENVIIPREEGKSENTKPLRTSQIYAQDEGMTHSQLFATRFELMKIIAGKRSQPSKPVLGGNPFQKNPKHASVLAESGINYDKPLPPTQVASLRADRIAKEKKALVEQARAQQQSGPSQQQPQQNGQQPAQTATVQPVQSQTQQLAVTQSQVVVQQQQQVTKAPSTNTTPISSPALLTGAIKTTVPGTNIATGTVSGNVVVSGVPPTSFQPINKRLVSPVVTGTVSASPAATTQMVQQRTAATATLPAEMVTIATSQGVRAVTPVTGGAVVTTNLTQVQTQARAVVTQVTTATTGGVQPTSKTLTPAQLQIFRSQQANQVHVPQIQAQASGQIKAVTKVSQEQLLKLQKQKLQQVAQTGTLAGTTQVQVQPQQTQQLATVTASRAGAVLASTTMTNLQVARLLQAQGQIQAQSGQTAQVALAKPPVVSAVVSPGGVTTLPVTVAGISVSINQPQKVAGGQTVVAQPLHMQQVLKVKHPTQQQQKALQSQPSLGQQKITTPQVSTASQQQKVTYTTQPGIKTQFLTTSLSQAQKAVGTQQVQAQIQVAKIPQVVQQQAAIATLQQVVSASQQVQPQTVTLTQATAPGQPQVQMIQAHVVQQKLLQQQVIAAAASPQIQAPDGQSTVPGLVSADAQNQQAKLQVRTPTVRIKAPTKPS